MLKTAVFDTNHAHPAEHVAIQAARDRLNSLSPVRIF
jgi:hypothetical protein